MASFNKITICGYLGRDPELRHTPNGNAVCNLSVATTEKRKNARGEAEDSTTWFRITVWGKQGEMCNQYLSKGSQVYVEGRLRQEEYTDREGQKRTTLEVNATDVQFLGKKSEDGEAPRGASHAAKAAAHELQKSPAKTSDDYRRDDSVPF